MKSLTTLFGFLFLLTSLTFAQDEATWSFSLEDKGKGEIDLVAEAKIKKGWHLYDTDIPDGGPSPTQLSFDKVTGAEPVGEFHADGKQATVKYDAIFQMNIGTFQDNARFVQRIRVTDKAGFSIQGDVRAQACDNSSCTPPLPHDFSFTAAELPATVTVAAPVVSAASETSLPLTTLSPAQVADSLQVSSPIAAISAEIDGDGLWTPVIDELQVFGVKGGTTGMSLFWIFLSGFIGGLIALVTPCVWPDRKSVV